MPGSGCFRQCPPRRRVAPSKKAKPGWVPSNRGAYQAVGRSHPRHRTLCTAGKIKLAVRKDRRTRCPRSRLECPQFRGSDGRQSTRNMVHSSVSRRLVGAHQHADSPHLTGLLPARRERPRRCTAERSHELPPRMWIVMRPSAWGSCPCNGATIP